MRVGNLNSDFPQANPGTFRNLITLLTPSVTLTAVGSVNEYVAGDPPATALVRIDYMRGQEQIKSGVDISQTYVKMTGNYDPAFTSACQVQTESGTIFDIQNVENVREMNMYMVLWCEGIGAIS